MRGTDRFGPCESVKISKEEAIQIPALVQQEHFSPPASLKTLWDAAQRLAPSAREHLRFNAANRDMIDKVCSGREEFRRLGVSDELGILEATSARNKSKKL